MIWDVLYIEVTQQEQAVTRQRMDNGNGGRRHVVMVRVLVVPPPLHCTALYCTLAPGLLDMHEILSLFILSKQKAYRNKLMYS